MEEIKIQIPDNCELVKNGDTYVVREKEEKDSKPKSWEEFCEKYPVHDGAYIDQDSIIYDVCNIERDLICDKNICVSKEEAEAFLALMQLRQLRKAWVGDWECPKDGGHAVIKRNRDSNKIECCYGCFVFYSVMSFPSSEMALDFMRYFGDLLEKAKWLL